MEEQKSASVKAIEITKSVFESVYNGLGLLKFAVESLKPTNGSDGKESQKWEIICSFYETVGSTIPTRYKVDVNLNDNTVSLEKLAAQGAETRVVYKFSTEEKGEGK